MPRNNDPKNNSNNNKPSNFKPRRKNNRNRNNKTRKNKNNLPSLPNNNNNFPTKVYTKSNFKSFDRWLVKTPAGSEFEIELREIVLRDPPFIPARIIEIHHLAQGEEWYTQHPYFNITFPFNPMLRMKRLNKVGVTTEPWRQLANE